MEESGDASLKLGLFRKIKNKEKIKYADISNVELFCFFSDHG